MNILCLILELNSSRVLRSCLATVSACFWWLYLRDSSTICPPSCKRLIYSTTPKTESQPSTIKYTQHTHTQHENSGYSLTMRQHRGLLVHIKAQKTHKRCRRKVASEQNLPTPSFHSLLEDKLVTVQSSYLSVHQIL